MEEQWKQLPDPLYSNYEFSNLGRVRKKKCTYIDKNGKVVTKNPIICTVSKEVSRSPRITLTLKNGTSKRELVDQIFAKLFVENPNEYKVVKHIDGDYNNLNASNLAWISAPTSPEFKTIKDLPNEQWKYIDDDKYYMVSNLGRVKAVARDYCSKQSNVWIAKPELLLTPTIEERSGYYSIGLRIGDNTKTFRVHRLVAQAFVPNPDNKPSVDHINQNKLDNKAINLRWVTAEENAINGGTSPVIVTFPDGTIQECNSIKEAAKISGFTCSGVRRQCLKGGTNKKGFKFVYQNIRSELGQTNRRKGNRLELEIIKELKNLGFNVASSRSQSKAKDNNKIDVCDLDGNLPTNIQIKYCSTTPNYFTIRDMCTDKTLPFTVIWKKSIAEKKSPGTVAIIPVELFYKLIQPYANKE